MEVVEVNVDPMTATLPLAYSDWGHMDGGWWVVMAIGMVLFWGLVIVGLVWLARELTGRGQGGLKLRQDPLELLDRRLAEGTISPEDYRERRAILTGSPPREGDG
jgi:putative membrane protein